MDVLVEAKRRDEAAERDVLHDDPRDQEVDVRVAGRLDRAAEHVAKQQHEHDRLHGEREQQIGRAREADQVALGDHERVGHEPPHAAASSFVSLELVLCGVSGQRQEHVVERRPAQHQVVDSDPGLAQLVHRLDDHSPVLTHGQSERPGRRTPAARRTSTTAR